METNDSLLGRAKRQMELLPSSAMPDHLFAEEEQFLVGEYTGERLFAQRPETYQLVISLLAEGMGVLRIGKVLRVSCNTVRAVMERERIPIDIEKKRIAGLCHAGAALAFEGVIEDLSDPVRRARIPTRDKAVAGAVMVDKGQLLSGEATTRLEVHEVRTPDHDDYNAYVAGLKAATTGLAGERAGQKGAPGSGATGVIEVGADLVSDDKATQHVGEQHT